jgi:YD repeat-containing protein
VDAIRKNSSFSTQAINPLSTIWVNEYRESEKIVWESDRYHLTQYKSEIYFDRTGRMVRYKTDANDVSFDYDPSGKLTRIKRGKDSIGVIQNSEGHILSFSTLDSAGMIKEARYTYDSAGLLIRSIDAGDNRYDYEYDRNKNMTFIRYSDGTYRRMEYDPATNRTTSLRQRNGDSSRYEYGYKYLADGRLNLDHFFTRIINYDSTGKRVFGSYWETEFRLKEGGDSYRYLMYEKTDTSESLYLYPTNVGNIIYGKVNAREAWQDYDLKTRPIYLRVNDSVFTTRYNVMGLPDRFQAIDSIKRDTLTFQYFYSAQGQLNRIVRNRSTYLIVGTVESGKVILTQGALKWEIGFSQGKPTYFIDPKGERLLLSELDKPDQAEKKKVFQDLLLLTMVQRIEHEWIWERL